MSPDGRGDARRLRRAVLINVAGTAGKALWPLVLAIAARTHGAAVLGTFLAIQAAVEIAHGLVALGYVDAIHRHTARRPGDPLPPGFGALVRGSLAAVALVEAALAALAVACALAAGLAHETVVAIAVMGGALVLQSGVTVLLAPCTAMLHTEYEVLVKQVLAPALVCALVLLLPARLVTLALAFALAYAACAAVALGIVQRRFGLARILGDRERPPPFRRYALLQGLNVGLWTSVYSLDTLLLALFVAPPLVALYRAGSEITRALYLVRLQFSGAFSPLAARYLADGELATLAAVLARLTATVTWLGAALAGGILVWREPLLAVALAAPPAEAGFVALLLAGQLLLCATSLTGNTLAMRGAAGLLVKNGLAMTAVNVALNLALDPWLGLTGAAIATITAMAVSQTLQLYELPRVVGIRHRVPVRVLASAIVALAVALGVEQLAGRVAATGVFALALGAALLTERRTRAR